MADSQLISTFVLAAHLGMSRDKLRRLARQGDIPYNKRGGEYWFDLQAVKAALRSKR